MSSFIKRFSTIKFNSIEGCNSKRINEIAERINKLDIFSDDQDDFATSIFSEIVPTNLDKEGRFLIPDELKNFEKSGSFLLGHPVMNKEKGIEFSTGSLGMGLALGMGVALSAKRKNKEYNTYVILGDGECNEGTTWESALFASHHKLNNLTVIIDANKYQSLKTTNETLSLEPFAKKWKSFGWTVFDIDGHNLNDISEALYSKSRKPKCIIANTIKGNGVDFMENNILWHYRSPQDEEYELAIEKLRNYER